MKTKMTRDQQLHRAATLRAAVIALAGTEGGVNAATVFNHLTDQGLEVIPGDVDNLLYRMCANKLLKKTPSNNSKFKYEYVLDGGAGMAPMPAPPKKAAVFAAPKGLVLDIKVNEAKGSVAVTYAGMSITISRAG